MSKSMHLIYGLCMCASVRACIHECGCVCRGTFSNFQEYNTLLTIVTILESLELTPPVILCPLTNISLISVPHPYLSPPNYHLTLHL